LALLRDVSNEEEAYFSDQQAYVAFVGNVPDSLPGTSYTTGSKPFTVPADVRIGAVLLSTDRYCIAVYQSSRKAVAFYDSAQGGVLTSAALAPKPCLHMARQLSRNSSTAPAIESGSGSRVALPAAG
jgi:hypothetical protein